MRTLACVAAVLLSVSATPALAHHSYSMFDREKLVSLSGTIRNFEMVNPHSYVWLVVKTSDSEQIWGLEGGGVAAMQRVGLNKSSVKVGETATFDFHPLRDGRFGGQLVRMTLKSGKVIGAPIEPRPATE